MLTLALNRRLTFVRIEIRIKQWKARAAAAAAACAGQVDCAASSYGWLQLWVLLQDNMYESSGFVGRVEESFCTKKFPWSEWFPSFLLPQDTSSLLSGGFRSMSLVDGMVFNALIAWNVRSSGHAYVKTYDLVLSQGNSQIETCWNILSMRPGDLPLCPKPDTFSQVSTRSAAAGVYKRPFAAPGWRIWVRKLGVPQNCQLMGKNDDKPLDLGGSLSKKGWHSLKWVFVTVLWCFFGVVPFFTFETKVGLNESDLLVTSTHPMPLKAGRCSVCPRRQGPGRGI